MNAGGYGSGKTLTSRQEVYRHIFATPNANILIGAKVAAQYEQTIKRDIENDLPAVLIKTVNVQKSYMDLINGTRIIYRSFDDPEKLRSLNLTMFVMVEASETTAETFQQLKTRLRNKRAMSKDLAHDWRKGIVETNPGAGWIRTDFLLNSAKIKTHGSSLAHYSPSLTPDINLSTHITSTDANKHLPPNFVTELVTNRPNWWVSKFVYGSFNYSEGLVYPSYSKVIVPTFQVPRTWKRIVAADYGLSDKFAYLAAALDQENGICYLYKNTTTTDRNVEFLANLYHEFTADIPQGGLLTAPIMDPKSGPRRDYDKKSLYSHFLDYGIAFQDRKSVV
jgi:PBSX family phage terminase large subunit